MKNTILVDVNFFNPFLKTLIEEAWTIRAGKMIYLLTTLLEKKYFRMSFKQLCLEIFNEWLLLIRTVVSRTKNG